MGNKDSNTHKKHIKIKRKLFGKEIEKKLFERNVLLIGAPKCGKTYICKSIANIYNEKDINCLKEFKYNLNESFVVHEFIDPSLMEEHGYSSYKYSDVIYQNLLIHRVDF
eukprot:548995_1